MNCDNLESFVEEGGIPEIRIMDSHEISDTIMDGFKKFMEDCGGKKPLSLEFNNTSFFGVLFNENCQPTKQYLLKINKWFYR